MSQAVTLDVSRTRMDPSTPSSAGSASSHRIPGAPAHQLDSPTNIPMAPQQQLPVSVPTYAAQQQGLPISPMPTTRLPPTNYWNEQHPSSMPHHQPIAGHPSPLSHLPVGYPISSPQPPPRRPRPHQPQYPQQQMSAPYLQHGNAPYPGQMPYHSRPSQSQESMNHIDSRWQQQRLQQPYHPDFMQYSPQQQQQPLQTQQVPASPYEYHQTPVQMQPINNLSHGHQQPPQQAQQVHSPYHQQSMQTQPFNDVFAGYSPHQQQQQPPPLRSQQVPASPYEYHQTPVQMQLINNLSHGHQQPPQQAQQVHSPYHQQSMQTRPHQCLGGPQSLLSPAPGNRPPPSQHPPLQDIQPLSPVQENLVQNDQISLPETVAGVACIDTDTAAGEMAEYKKFATLFGLGGVTPTMMDKAFKKAVGEKYSLSFDDFSKVLKDIGADINGKDDNVKKLFNLSDKDKDGSISKKEIHNMLNTVIASLASGC